MPWLSRTDAAAGSSRPLYILPSVAGQGCVAWTLAATCAAERPADAFCVSCAASAGTAAPTLH